MLYNEVKAEQEFLTLINAAVSHELRNPLSSLIAQSERMNDLIDQFSDFFQSLKVGITVTKDMVSQATTIYQGLTVCNTKITSAAKFIDYFVHDILDYTILNKDTAKFVKNMEVFSIKSAIQEIVQILEDKIGMKRIKLKTLFKDFDIF
jgi:signal transduction histidine kinase